MAMRSGIQQRRLVWWGVVGFVVLAALQISGFQTFLDLREAWRQEAEIEQEVVELKARIAELEASVESLEPEDGEAIILEAREILGVALPGQIVIKLPNKE
jgi:cell division protein FtsB